MATIPNGSVYVIASDLVVPPTTQTVTTNSAAYSVDWTTIACHLTVTAVSGTSPSMTVKFQDSGDGINWVDIPSGAFTAATTTGAQRLVLSTVGRMIRTVSTITGTAPSFTYSVTAVGRS